MKNNQQGFAAQIIIAIVVLVLVVAGIGGYYFKKSQIEKEAMEQKEKEETMQKDEGEMMEKKDNEMMNHDSMMKEEEGAMMDKGEMMAKYSGAILAGESSPLLDFAKADYDAALKTDKLVVLYFYANWCPICKVEVPELYAAFNDLKSDKVIGFRVNYNDSDTDDNEKALAREFGVAYQHTKVFVKNGQRILKAPDSWNKGRYLNEINKALTQ